MFKQQEKKDSKGGVGIKDVETIIGPSVKVKGNFESAGNIIVEGVLEGSIKTEGNVFIGDKAEINANIKAKEARIGGKILGNIAIKGRLEIASSARIFGDIECSIISIESGAILNGKCSMTKDYKGVEKEVEKINNKEKKQQD